MLFRWFSSGFGNSGDNDWITNNDGANLWPDTSGGYDLDYSTHHLITKQTSITDHESSSLGYIELKGSGDSGGTISSLTIKPGIQYYFSFWARASKQYYNYVADGAHCDRPPFVTLHSTTSTDGTDTGMHLFSNNTWVAGLTSISSTITITDFTELNPGDKVNLIATDTNNYDFVCGDQSSANGTWEAASSNNATATNLMNVINTSSGPSGTRFSATVAGAVVTITQNTEGVDGNTTVIIMGEKDIPYNYVLWLEKCFYSKYAKNL